MLPQKRKIDIEDKIETQGLEPAMKKRKIAPTPTSDPQQQQEEESGDEQMVDEINVDDIIEDEDENLMLSDEDEENEDEEEGEDLLFFEDDDIVPDMFENNVGQKNTFEVVDSSNLCNSQQEKILQVGEMLNVPSGTAGVLLKHFKWDAESLYNLFFDDPEKICKEAGVNRNAKTFVKLSEEREGEETCVICYDDFPTDRVVGLTCRHFFCMDCWRKYLQLKIEEGYASLMTPCAYRGCHCIVPEEFVKFVVEEKYYKRYSKFIARSFVDDNPRIKWCPAPDCGKAIYCPIRRGKVENVICSCGEKFCFHCGREAHEPCTCDDLLKWKLKEQDEQENVTWLQANAKFCPGCNKPIEKNGGCNHMTCGGCKHEFCWICMDDWKVHGGTTGGFYRCNRYSSDELEKKLDLKARNEAKSNLQKYLFYFERYANHANSQKFEKELLKKAEKNMKSFQKRNRCTSWIDVEFIQNAVSQLIACRNVLKYTYIFAFYLEDVKEKNMFEFWQEDLERVTESLSEMLERPIETYRKEKILENTNKAKTMLVNLLSGCKSGIGSVY